MSWPEDITTWQDGDTAYMSGPFTGLLAVLRLAGFFGAPLAVLFGGIAVIQHLTLRLILTRSGRMPANYARFLDYATSRHFLHKVGGGYIFVHRLLLEYFAQLTPGQMDELAE